MGNERQGTDLANFLFFFQKDRPRTSRRSSRQPACLPTLPAIDENAIPLTLDAVSRRPHALSIAQRRPISVRSWIRSTTINDFTGPIAQGTKAFRQNYTRATHNETILWCGDPRRCSPKSIWPMVLLIHLTCCLANLESFQCLVGNWIAFPRRRADQFSGSYHAQVI